MPAARIPALLVMITMVGTAHAQTAQPSITQQIQKLTGGADKGQALGQALVIGSLLGCTQKQAGKDATNAFYNKMQTVGQTAEGYCKAGKPELARELVLTIFEQNKTDPVTKSALTCYDSQTQSVSAMGGAKMATDMARYARWLRDPATARREMKESDICKGIPTVGAAPVAPVSSAPLSAPH